MLVAGANALLHVDFVFVPGLLPNRTQAEQEVGEQVRGRVGPAQKERKTE